MGGGLVPVVLRRSLPGGALCHLHPYQPLPETSVPKKQQTGGSFLGEGLDAKTRTERNTREFVYIDAQVPDWRVQDGDALGIRRRSTDSFRFLQTSINTYV